MAIIAAPLKPRVAVRAKEEIGLDFLLAGRTGVFLFDVLQ
jgi:hypothetical protein